MKAYQSVDNHKESKRKTLEKGEEFTYLSAMKWELRSWEEITRDELYEMLQLRSEVFIVEQDCPYQDLDDKDQKCLHLWARDECGMIAHARLVPKGVSYDLYASIGRVVASPKVRGTGVGQELMEKSVAACLQHFPGEDIKISAQQYLIRFYEKFGFRAIGDGYLEDNIPHIAMIRKVK